jgi:hypothetical protein
MRGSPGRSAFEEVLLYTGDSVSPVVRMERRGMPAFWMALTAFSTMPLTLACAAPASSDWAIAPSRTSAWSGAAITSPVPVTVKDLRSGSRRISASCARTGR